MQILEVSKKNFEKKRNDYNTANDNYRRLVIDNGILQTEADLYIFYYLKKKYVLKQMYPFEFKKYENKIKTLLSVEEHDSIVPEYFIKPRFLVRADDDHPLGDYWASDFVNGTNLNLILKDDRIPFNTKKKYLIKIGSILKEMDDIRKHTSLNNFFIGDLHENNFMVDRQGNLLVGDIDSIRIAGNKSSTARYLTPFSLFNKVDLESKYKSDLSDDKIGDYIVDRNTDLYCYMMILLNFLTDKRINGIEISDFYRYLNYFNDIGIDEDLIVAFSKVLTSEDNINPYEYVSTLTENQVAKARVKKL